MFVIEDERHVAVQVRQYATLQDTMTELKRMAKIRGTNNPTSRPARAGVLAADTTLSSSTTTAVRRGRICRAETCWRFPRPASSGWTSSS